MCVTRYTSAFSYSYFSHFWLQILDLKMTVAKLIIAMAEENSQQKHGTAQVSGETQCCGVTQCVVRIM